MTSTSLLATPKTSPTLTMTDLVTIAHADGIRVWWRHLNGRDGQWSARHRSIWLEHDLTAVKARSVLAHELGHAALGHDGPQNEQHELGAWQWAAQLLLSQPAYATAETVVGPHPGAVADELGVSRSVVLAYQRTLEAA
ncbi:MAG: ImmA/IrrE family metallo-endopeptidase [Brachybacterium sp.]|uniref:ImmA/IrrE family metallo-endopeptidase n=1 Tax=Brachybacterium sp. TaxID=1891286 RepID=UPI002648435E|nr:ImmA/IrrE family metallo-endopeptidase [Brachybacterium sp.]MDN5687786.1 ImmA/IrrE family metallo-endopeptidase [Brachybacterium sp.]